MLPICNPSNYRCFSLAEMLNPIGLGSLELIALSPLSTPCRFTIGQNVNWSPLSIPLSIKLTDCALINEGTTTFSDVATIIFVGSAARLENRGSLQTAQLTVNGQL